ncbi:MAG: hypothetical protein E6I40_05080 [Chloroflexi bacterium]|nr:MAG: hypothetical protein E6I40_05080 [Chloroflexota bacterium]
MANAATARAFQYGLGIFALTALIGLANAIKIFGTIDQNTLLTHLHSGTLGWITMGVFGIAVALFARNGSAVGPNVRLSALATAAYVLAFWSGNFIARAVFGLVMLATIFGWWAWVVYRAQAIGFGRLTVAQLSILLGLTTLVIGSTVGVILQVLFATSNVTDQTGVLIGVHASAQVGGYLVLVAAGIAEWHLSGETRTTAGRVQAVLLFLAGLLLALGILLNVTPALLLSNVFQTVAIVMVALRVGRRAFGIGWGAPTGARHEAIAVGWLVVALVLFIALTQQLIAAQGDNSKIPPGLFIALDHTMFIGVMTNVLFGTVLALGAPRTWPWADHVIFWGLNAGAASFVVVLLTAGSSAGAGPFGHPVAFTAPIRGLAVLLGIVTFSMRLAGAPAMATAPART